MHVATFGKRSVTIHKWNTPRGNIGFMVSHYATVRRRFDSFPTEQEAIARAQQVTNRLSRQDAFVARLTLAESRDISAAVQTLEEAKVSLLEAAPAVKECPAKVDDLDGLREAVKWYVRNHKRTVAKPVADVVAELRGVKEQRGAASRYLEDLRGRLGRFAEAFHMDASAVTTASVQKWMDRLRTHDGAPVSP